MNAQWTKNKRKDSLYLLLHGYGETPEVWHNVQKMIGDENFPVFGSNEIHRVKAGEIVFVNHPKYYDKALQSDATIILIDKET